MSLQRFWNRNAHDWSSWARDPDHDFYFWEFNLPALLGIIPKNVRRVLDLGCGEGRVARALTGMGMSVVGVDASGFLAGRAATGNPAVPTAVATGAALPFSAGAFDAVVASMSLHDMADARGAAREAARVLVPGGWLCFSIVHPTSSWQAIQSRPDAPASYFQETNFCESVSIGEQTLSLMSAHRPTEWYFRMLVDAGFQPEVLLEPCPAPDAVRRSPLLADMTTSPRFLHMRGRLAT
jgi:SAM-dependent methyltransferase